MGRWNDYGYFTPAPRRKAVGGIKMQSKKTSETWWAKKWIAVLESFDIGARLARGRSYARSGQVISISIEKGTVAAKVQGSRPKPYSITINMKTFSAEEVEKLKKALGSQTLFTAKLLGGEMPQDIETAFQEANLKLFPAHKNDLKTNCSCPDWSNPCKHIAAVYYLLGEEFDRDPFLIFKLRGISQDDLAAMLDSSPPSKKEKKKSGAKSAEKQQTQTEMIQTELLPIDPEKFWRLTGIDNFSVGEVSVPTQTAPLLRQIGKFPFWRGTTGLVESLSPAYESASKNGLKIFMLDN